MDKNLSRDEDKCLYTFFPHCASSNSTFRLNNSSFSLYQNKDSVLHPSKKKETFPNIPEELVSFITLNRKVLSYKTRILAQELCS